MGHEPTVRGIVTALIQKIDNRVSPLSDEQAEIVRAFRPTNVLADAMGWPKQWLTCPHCGEQSWRMPPHVFDACPLVEEMAKTTGLKLDAEAATARRAGISLEKQVIALQAYLDRLIGDDE